jgi:hypothetical protein
MYEFEVVLMEKTFGRVRVIAEGPEQARELALHSPDIEWDEPSDAEVILTAAGRPVDH